MLRKMNREFVEKNYEITLLLSAVLCVILPFYMGIFLICSIVAAGRGTLYKERLAEFLRTLSENNINNEVDTGDATPITRSRNRKRRGSN